MDIPDQSVGGLLSPIISFKKHEITRHNYHIEPRIAIDQKDTYHHNTDIYTNSSQNRILSLSGPNNEGMMLNDARFHTSNVFERPIFFNLHPHATLWSFILVLVFFLFVIFTVIGTYIYSYQKRQQAKPKGIRTTIPFRQYKQLNSNLQNNIRPKKNLPRLNKSTVLSTHKRIQKDNKQNEKNFLEENDHNKIEAKVTKCSNMIVHTHTSALPEQDKMMSKIRLSTGFQQNSASSDIYDIPPAHSISQWAHNELLKYMKI